MIKYLMIIWILLLTTALAAEEFQILDMEQGSGDIQVSVTFNNVTVNGGKLYIAVYDSADAQKKEIPFAGAIVEAQVSTITLYFMLKPGDYVVSAYQDTNGNGQLDTNFLGIPREPVGLSNYNGRGIPGGFNRLKTRIDNQNTEMVVNMTTI